MNIPVDSDASSLLRRIEFDAGSTNSDILSDPEWRRGKTLVSETEEVLLSLDQEIERLIARRDSVAKRLSRFRIAVAPHKRLPPEVLGRIFVCTLNHDPVSFPPERSRSPWVLRKICSSWRQVALNEPCLWNNIAVVPMRLSSKMLSGLMKYIHVMTPPSGPLLISLNIGLISHIPPTPVINELLVPNFSRIRRLDLEVHVSVFILLCEVTLGHFSALESMRIDLWAADEPDAGWFALAESFRDVTIFRRAHRLKDLDLSLSFHGETGLSNVLFGLPFAWTTLTTLALTATPLTLSHIHGILRQCAALMDLHAELDYHGSVPEPTSAEHNLELPYLRQVELQGILASPHSLTDLQLPWDQLITLRLSRLSRPSRLGSLTLSEAYNILRRCTCVKTLSMAIQSIHSPSEIPDEVITLPNLEDLKLCFEVQAYILDCLLLPVLNRMHLESPSLPSAEVSNMIIRSSCSLSTFFFDGLPVDGFVNLQSVTTLLDLMPSVTDFRMLDLILDHNVTYSIACGELLPRATAVTLMLGTDSLVPFVEALERRRIEGLAPAGAKVDGLRHPVAGYLARDGDSAEVREALIHLRRLNEEYRTDWWVRMAHWRGILPKTSK